MKISQFVKLIPNCPKQGYYLAFNTLTQKAVAVHETLLGEIERAPFTSQSGIEDRASIHTLQEAGVLVDESTDEIESLLTRRRKQTEDKKLLELTVQVTTACNLSCIYCFQKPLIRERARMPGHVQDQVLLWLKQAIAAERSALKLLDISFYGGEALLELDLICGLAKRVREIAEEANLPVLFSTVSNGTLLTPETVERLRNVGFTKIQITLDGQAEIHDVRRPFKDGTGSFSQIWNNLLYATSKMQVGLTINYDVKNQDAIPALLDLLVEEGLSERLLFILFGNIIDFTYRDSMEERVLRQLCSNSVSMADAMAKLHLEGYKRGLPVNFNMPYAPCRLFAEHNAFITPHGDIYKCIASSGIDRFKLGTIFDTTMSEVCQISSKYDFAAKARTTEPCATCVYLPLCEGGCRLQAYLKFNDLNRIHCQRAFFNKGVMPVIEYLYQQQVVSSLQSKR